MFSVKIENLIPHENTLDNISQLGNSNNVLNDDFIYGGDDDDDGDCMYALDDRSVISGTPEPVTFNSPGI